MPVVHCEIFHNFQKYSLQKIQTLNMAIAMDISATLDSIEAMVRQEERAYHPPSRDQDPMAERFVSVGIESRGCMLTFYYNLLEKIGSSRETAEIAVNYLDRVLASPSMGPKVLRNKRLFQLISTTCLYTAVKMHEIQAITPSLLADLSQGAFTAEDVEEMEVVLAQTLQWRLNPPTSLAFVRHYLDLVPRKLMSRQLKSIAYRLAVFQTEYALADECLFTERKAAVAFWAVENTLTQLHIYDDELSAYMSSAVFGYHGMSPGQRKSQTALNMALTAQLGLIVPSYNTPPATAEAVASTNSSKSWFSFGLRTLPPTSRSEYHISPRSVGNTMA